MRDFEIVWLVDVDDTAYIKPVKPGSFPYVNPHLVSFFKKIKTNVINFFTAYDVAGITSCQEIKADNHELFRNDIINELKKQGIKVDLVITNNDLLEEEKIPGSHYEKVIKKWEIKGSIKDANLRKDDEFNFDRKRAAENETKLKEVVNGLKYKSIKGPLLELVASYFEKNEKPVFLVLIDDNPNGHIFNDARKANKKFKETHKNLEVVTLLARPYFTPEDYLTQLEPALPEIAYECFLTDLANEFLELEKLGLAKTLGFFSNDAIKSLEDIKKFRSDTLIEFKTNKPEHNALEKSSELLDKIVDLKREVVRSYSGNKSEVIADHIDYLSNKILNINSHLSQIYNPLTPTTPKISKESANENINPIPN